MNEAPRKGWIRRYSPAERLNHWVTALTFVMLALSGLSLFHPSQFWLTQLFGGPVWTRILHPFVGVILFLSFAGLVIRFWGHNRLGPHDRAWLARIGDVLRNREENLPEVDRYNAGQKLLFWMLVVTIPTLLVTGVIIWRPWFAGYFAIGTLRMALLIHAISAFVAMVGILVHLYAALWIQGTMGAMLRGRVSRAWARKHHPGWYRRVVRREEP